MKITQMSAENRPRERLTAQGPSALSTAELLALILKSGTQKENVLQLCQNLLAKYGLEKLGSCSLQQLMQEHGIGKAKACQVVAIFELYKRMEPVAKEGTRILRAEDIVEKYKSQLQHLEKEHFVAVYLDARHKIIKDETITVGILNASLIHPREVFHGALRHLASAVIVLHNHPSGDCTPSTEDLDVTQRLKKTGEIMGIPLLDHIIIGRGSYWSWKEH